MNIGDMDQDQLIKLGAEVLLRHGEMSGDNLFEALARFHRLCVGAALIQGVVDGRLDMTWRDCELHFGIMKKEGACRLKSR